AADAVHVVQGLVHEQADRRHKRRQMADYRARPIGIDEARAVRPEDEADRVRAGLDRVQRILEPRDTTDFHEHQCTNLHTFPALPLTSAADRSFSTTAV